MVALLALLGAAAQAPQVEVTADRERIAVGETVTVTVTVRAAGALPVEIAEPAYATIAVLDRRERSQVSVEDGIRTTRREILLRPERPGTVVIGPFVVRQEEASVESETVTVVVTSVVPMVAELSPRVRAVIDRAMPSGAGEPDAVEVAVLASADSVVLGEQIDLVVAAWFPREVLNRLRAPPAVLPPDVRGAWGYAQPAPAGIVATRTAGGRRYDLFVHHEIVFALTAGDLEVGPATVSYSLPVTGSFLSREVRYEEQSTPFLVAVSSPPERPDARGVPGRDMTLTVDAPQTTLPLGDAVSVSIALSGLGNVALWPEPTLRWPGGVQAYQQRAAVEVSTEQGLLGGTKLFEYLVVADSAGLHRLPAPSYRYFDLTERRYVTIEGAAVVFATPSPPRAAEPVRAPPALLERSPWHGFEGALRRLPAWVWVVVFAVPPLAALGLARRRRRQRPHAAAREGSARHDDALALLAADFSRALRRLVPGADALGADRLTAALVAAGVESSLAAHATRVRERLRAARYGPDGGTDPTELGRETQAVRDALTAQGRREWRAVTGAALVLLAVLSGPVQSQTVAELWQAGAVRPVADSLLARTRSEPSVPAHWYNLGLAFEQLGQEARARAAWLEAARLAPRVQPIRRAAPSDDGPAGAILWIAPLTPREALAAAALLWLAGWVLLVQRRRRRAALVSLVVAVGFAAFAGVVAWRYRLPVGFVVTADTPLREAPYGPAPSSLALGEGAAVGIDRAEADWRLVRRGEWRGWLHATELVEY